MKLRALVLALTAGLLVAAGGKDDAKDKEKLIGTWAPVSITVGGKPRPDEEVKKSKMVIAADKITILREGKDEDKATYKIDTTKKPRTIDITPSTGGEAGQVMPGIYELDGDTLKMCFARPKGERPKEFASKEGTENAVIVLKRAK